MNGILENNSIDQHKEIQILNEEIKRLKNESVKLEQKILLNKIALNSSHNSTVITDKDGNIIWVNKAFTELTGYSFLETINKNPRILKSGKHSKKYYENLWNTITSGKEWKDKIIIFS